MTPNPFYGRFSKYRNDIFDDPRGANYEFLTINWANSYSINKVVQSEDCGGSAYYMKPDRMDREPHQKDEKIHKNHEAGLYLKFCSSKRYAGFYFAGSEAIFHFRAAKVSQCIGDFAQAARSGATSQRTLTWSTDHNSWQSNDAICDGVAPFTDTITIEPQEIFALPPLSRERLISLSIGRISRSKDWHKARNLAGLQVDDSEVPKGSLVKLRDAQNDEIEGRLHQLSTLTTNLLKGLPALATKFTDLKNGDVKLGDLNGTYRSNIRIAGCNAHALIVYVGEKTESSAKMLFDELITYCNPDRLIFFYVHLGQMKNMQSSLKTIDNTDISPTDIFGG
jgi:hypothetical protein